jgi:chemotaxis family two-component system response regulator Rcp1
MQESLTSLVDCPQALDSVTVLLVEDDPDDVYLTQQALRAGKLRLNLEVVSDGVAALQYLRSGAGRAQRRRPDLILLDLNLPRMDGREVLTEVKHDPDRSSLRFPL